MGIAQKAIPMVSTVAWKFAAYVSCFSQRPQRRFPTFPQVL